MGMFDEIRVGMVCPFCGYGQGFLAQAKDLSCAMYTYEALPEDWYTNAQSGKAFRSGLCVPPKFPLDKAAGVWRDQAERREAAATLDRKFADQFRYVNVIATCGKCDKRFRGKIEVRDGKLMGPIYDIVAD